MIWLVWTLDGTIAKPRRTRHDPAERYVEIADRICERGWFGQKTGRGFYLYPGGARIGTPDPEILALIEAERAKKSYRGPQIHRGRDYGALSGRNGQ
jgi:3-hydroxyacyl-CoA dehydrogenase